jgi:hypothetical protein
MNDLSLEVGGALGIAPRRGEGWGSGCEMMGLIGG